MADNNSGAFNEQAPTGSPQQQNPVSPTDDPSAGIGRKSVDINRLSDLRSYSYYFSLIMCKNADIAEAMVQQTNVNAWQHPTSSQQARLFNVQGLGIYAPRGLDGSGNSDDYCVLINGATDATFAINDVKWLSATAAEAVPGDSGTSIAIEGSIKVSEPRGVLFINQIVTCGQALGVDPSTVVWVMKPFFVGYGNNGSLTTSNDFVQYINDIAPIMFIPYDVAAVYSELGGTYDIQFVGLANGASRLPQYSRAADGFTAQIGPSLKDAMQQLQDVINRNYEHYKTCFLKKLQDLDGTDFINQQDNYKTVQYIIVLDPVYCADKYTVSDRPQQFGDDPKCQSKTYIKQTVGGSIESAIRTIMQMSPEIQQEMVGNKDTGIKLEYKVQTAIRPQEKVIQIIYSIKQFVSPKGGIVEQLTGGSSSSSRVISDQIIKNNLVEFDYIYTGLNTDILEFDLKVNLGMAYIQTAASANSFKSQLEATGSRSTHIDPNVDLNRFNPDKRVQIPLFFGAQAQRRGINSIVPGDAVGASYTLAKHANLETAEATIRIRGNTAYLETASHMSMPENVLKFVDATANVTTGTNSVCSAVVNPTSQVQTDNRKMLMGDFPLLAKINIKMPANSDDLQAFQDKSNYAANFWFEGYYYVYGIEHEFNMGEFTQTLNMIALPDPGTFKFLDNKKKTATSFTEMITQCYDGLVPCQKPGAPADGSPQTKTAADKVASEKGCSTDSSSAEQQQQQGKLTNCDDAVPPQQIQQTPDGPRTVHQSLPPPPLPEVVPLLDDTQEQKNLWAFRHALASGEGTLLFDGNINYGKIVRPGTNVAQKYGGFTDHPFNTGQMVYADNYAIVAAHPVKLVQTGRGAINRPTGSTFAYVDLMNGTAKGDKFILASSAAGAYQFVVGTWDALASKLSLGDFGPANQDKAADQLFKQNHNAYDDIKAGRINTAIGKLTKVWASLPGASNPGQHTVDIGTFMGIYRKFGGINIEEPPLPV